MKLIDKTNKTIQAYNKNINLYNNKFMEYSPYMNRVNEFIDLLQDGLKVLDIGCGPGNVSRQLVLSGKDFNIRKS